MINLYFSKNNEHMEPHYLIKKQRKASSILAMAVLLLLLAEPSTGARTRQKIVNIAYSTLLDDECTINTMDHFRAAVQAGFSYLKTDMRLTSDGEIVLCHDAGFTFNEEGKITKFNRKDYKAIHDMTLAEVLALEHERKHGRVSRVATMDEFLAFCRRTRVSAYITVRNEYQDETLEKLAELLERHKMQERVIINNYPASDETCASIRRVFPNTPISYTIPGDLTKEIIDKVVDLGSESVVCVNHERVLKIDDDLWSYAREHAVPVYGWIVWTRDQYLSCLKAGCEGFQISKIEVIK